MKNLFLLILFMISIITKVTFADSLDEAINNSDRTPLFAERDIYRNPKETLQFFGIKNDMSVIELWPSRGWYSEILEPYLSSEGKFLAADFDPNYASWTPKVIKRNTENRAKSKLLSNMKMITLYIDDTPLERKETFKFNSSFPVESFSFTSRESTDRSTSFIIPSSLREATISVKLFFRTTSCLEISCANKMDSCSSLIILLSLSGL